MSGHGFAKIHGLQWTLQQGGYQFYTTTPNVEWAESSTLGYEYPFHPSGSSVWVPTPKSPDRINAVPIASLVQQPPGTEVDGWNTWNYIGPTPNTLDDLGVKMLGDMFKTKGQWQVDGISKHSWFHTNQKFQLIETWVKPDGHISYSGTLAPATMIFQVQDVLWDLPPGLLRGLQYDYRIPDTDWYGRGCYTVVGDRLFYIGSDAENYFYCCPVGGDIDNAFYADFRALYGENYSANINPDQGRRVLPIYPEWVYVNKKRRDLYKDDPEINPCEPRYAWSFHSSGRKAIAVLLERKESEATFHKIDYAPDIIQADDYYPGLGESLPYSSPVIPTEVQIGDGPPEIDPSKVLGKNTDPRVIETEKRGYVELEFDIEITGPGLDEFIFTIGVISSESPDELYQKNIGVLVDIAYAQPLDWTRVSGPYLTGDVFSTEENVIHSLWIQLYRHERQKHLVDTYDGEICLNVTSRSITTFRKGKSFSKMFSLPLAQSHGDGYTYNPLPPEVALPSPAHDPVWNPDQSFGSKYPQTEDFPEGFEKKLYYYSGKITHVDLSTLSFYYTVRLLSQEQGPRAPVDHSPAIKFYHITKILNKAKKMCFVCMMGRSIDEYVVGNDDLPTDWLRGWVRYAGDAGLFEKEELIDSDLIHNIRGSGFVTSHAHATGILTTPILNGPDIKKSWIITTLSTQNYGINVTLPYDQYMMYPQTPWWFMGACGHITQAVIASMLVPYLYPDYAGWSLQFPLSPVSIDSVYDLNIATLMSYIYNAWGTYYNKYPDSPLLDMDLTDIYDSNPFLLASGMSEEDFVKSTANSYTVSMFKDIFKYYKTALDNADGSGKGFAVSGLSVYPYEGGFSYGTRVPLSIFALNTGGGMHLNSPDMTKMSNYHFNALVELSGSDMPWKKMFHIGHTVKNYELGAYYYNQAIYNHFTPGGMDLMSAIRVTANGTCAYSQRGFYEFKNEFSTTYTLNEHFVITASAYNANLTDEYAKPMNIFYERPATGVSQIQWDSIDGISWDYGSIRTKHLYLYNLAYQPVKKEDMKTHLESDEEFAPYYSKQSFMPQFFLINNGRDSFIFPSNHDQERLGIPSRIVYDSLPIGSSPARAQVTGAAKRDPRYGLKMLALSSVFVENKKL
jgi:hypothetical protein